MSAKSNVHSITRHELPPIALSGVFRPEAQNKELPIYKSALVVSDSHNGDNLHPAADGHMQMIALSDVELIVLNGDIIDFEEIFHYFQEIGLKEFPKNFAELAEKNIYPPNRIESMLQFLDVCIDKAQQGARIVYVTGNHDNVVEALHGQNIHGIEFKPYFLANVGGKDSLFLHGHQGDKNADANYRSPISKFFNTRYFEARKHDHKKQNNGYYTNMWKEIGKGVVNNPFRKKMATFAHIMGAEQVFAGHIHEHHIGTVNIKQSNANGTTTYIDITYCNTGDDADNFYKNGSGAKAILADENSVKKHTISTIDKPYNHIQNQEIREKSSYLMEKLYAAFKNTVRSLDCHWQHDGKWNTNPAPLPTKDHPLKPHSQVA